MELKSFEELERKPSVVESSQHADRDEVILARFGKKQRLRRRFGLLPSIGLTCTLMITWEGVTSTLLNGLQNGGPAGVIYGYLFCWAGGSIQALVVAEMASMIPLAGGPFNWVAVLSPPWCKKFLSYLTGWLTMITYLSIVSATCYVSATVVQGLLILNDPSYVYENWHGTLLFYAVVFFALFINTYLGRLLPQIESLILLFHILGFAAILISIVYLTPKHQPASFVFGYFINNGGWSTNFLSTLIGLVMSSNVLTGMDAADHIAEETVNAPKILPIAIGSAYMLNGILGFALLLGILFSMPDDVQGVLASTTYYPFIDIFAYATGSNAGGSALTAILFCTQTFGVIGMLATASRMIWAFAREGGLPFSRFLSRVNERARLPIYAIVLTAVINFLLALINIGSTVGFTAFISLIIASYNSSLIIAASMMLHKRYTTPYSEIPWGYFRMGRRVGPVVLVLAIIYSIITGFFSLWPSFVDPTPEEMNWSPLIYGGVLLFSVIFWFAHGKSRYTGPVLEL